jgi:hypothetical protein
MPSREKPPRRAAPVVLAILLFAARAAGAQKADEAGEWISLSPAGEAFTALMPAKPAVKQQAASPGGASPGGRLYTATGRDSAVYLVWSLEGPPAAGDQVSAVSDYLDSCAELAWNVIVVPEEKRARRNPTFGPQGRYAMFYVRDVKDGYFMREYLIRLNERRGAAYIFTDGSRAYIAAAYGRAAGDPNVEKFLDSFAVKLPGGAGSIKMPRRPVEDHSGAGSGGGAPGIGGGQGGGGVPLPGRNIGGGARAGTPEAERAPGTPCGNSSDKVFQPGELTRRARITARPEPLYTEWARKFSVTGTVRVRAILKADGTVGGATAVTRLPHGLTRKAFEAMRGIRFEPGEKDGCKVAEYVTVDYNFNIY